MSYIDLLNKMKWSFSRLHSYEQCPYSFYLTYIEKRKGESNFYASNGKCMHEVFEAILNNEIDIQDCTQLYTDKYDLICETTKQSTMDSTFEKCINYLSAIDNIDLNKYEIIGVEMKLDFKIQEYNFVGFADLVVKNKQNGEIILIDHKQANHFLKKDGTPLKNQIDNFLAYKHQMYVYCKGLKECHNIDVNKIVWHHFKDDGKLTIIPFDINEYEETIQWVIDTIEKIKADETFAENISYVMCSSLCNHRNSCEYKDEV